MTTPYIDPNIIFAENAPIQDKPAAFANYDKGMDETRKNDGRPTIKQFNFLQQQNDLKNRYIHENGAALPYKEGIAYEENAIVVKDGVLQQWKGGEWKSAVESELADKADKSSNLSDLASAETARTNLGLGTAATATLTTSTTDSTNGRAIKVGDFGLGSLWAPLYDQSVKTMPAGFFRYADGSPYRPSLMGSNDNYGIVFRRHAAQIGAALFLPYHTATSGQICLRAFGDSNEVDYYLKHSRNTTVDSNGFIKNASPVVQLFADKIELNDEAQQQSIEFEKLGVGDYLIKGSTGFAQEGWYIETPKDANGNLLVAVVYEQLENGDISVKTYDYMLNNKGRIVADTETPLDIPENRWIDLRLQALPHPEAGVTDDPEDV